MSSTKDAQKLEAAPSRKPRHDSSGANVVEAAKKLGPVLRERSAETTQLRRLPDASWEDLIDTGILRALQPARWGGAEVHPNELFSAVIEIARAEGSTGWVTGIIGVHPWHTALFANRAQEEMWRDEPAAMNSSSYAPTGKAERVSGGYRLSGRWSFSSGCDHCQWINLAAISGTVSVEGNEMPDLRSFLLPRKDYKIDDNWFVAGLSGTGSKDILVDGAFVPEYRSLSHWDDKLGIELPGWELNTAPLYRLPWAVMFISGLASAALGASLGFLDTWTEISRTRRAGFGGDARDDPYTQQIAAEAGYTINTSILRLHRDCEEMMEMAHAGEPFSLKQRARFRYNAARSAQLAGRAVESLWEVSSGRKSFLDHPLQRRYQDIKTMLGHAGLNPKVPGKFLGAMELGNQVLNAIL